MMRVLLISGCLAAGSTAAFCQTKNFIDQPYVQVQARADSLVTPNQIFIRIQISERDSRDKISLEASENKMISALKNMGIDVEHKLRTSDLLSNYKSYLLKQRDVIKSKQYLLEVEDAQTASKVFMGLEDLDISNTAIDHLDHTELESIRNACRVKAVQQAKARAESLTSPLSQSLGPAIQITDQQEIQPVPDNMRMRMSDVVVTGYGAAQNKLEPAKIDFEKIRVSVAVGVVFVLK